MREKLFIVAIIQMLFFSCKISEQHTKENHCKQEFDTLLNSKVYTQVDVMPTYDNNDGVLGYFSQHLKMTNEDEFQSSIKLLFIVDTMGFITSARIRNKERENWSAVEKEAIKIAQNMPKWSVGKCDGKAVPVRINLNIVF